MSLHGGEDGDNKSMRESVSLFMAYPPIMEGFVRLYVEWLLGSGGFSEGIGDIRGRKVEHWFV